MKDLVGRKVKGFKFENDVNRVCYESDMDKHIGEVGVIKRYDEFDKTFKVEFEDDYWYYPASEIEQHLVFEPKRGDEAMFSDDGKKWVKSIFAGEIEGAIRPFQAVSLDFAKEFLNNEPFDTFPWKYMKPLPNKTKVTKQQIADILGVDLDNLEIVD